MEYKLLHSHSFYRFRAPPVTYPEPVRPAPRERRLDPVGLQREDDAGEADVRAVERGDPRVVVEVLQDAPARPGDRVLLPDVLRHPLLERPQVVQESLVRQLEVCLGTGQIKSCAKSCLHIFSLFSEDCKILSKVSHATGLKEQFHAHLAAGGNMQFVRNGTE